MNRFAGITLLVCLSGFSSLVAQDPTGAIEGVVTDKTSSAVSAAHVVAKNLDTGFTKEATTLSNGLFRVPLLPVGRYSVTVEAAHFATLVRQPITLDVSQTVRIELQLDLASVQSTVTVTAEAPLVDSATNVLGATVTGREIVDLPLNGRNFTQPASHRLRAA